ncbi:MAG: nucleoside 2-deoxyribosyltransferase [bacterium]
MRIYIICPVRKANAEDIVEQKRVVGRLRVDGHAVYWPPEDAPQEDPTGLAIVESECEAIRDADIVCVLQWRETQGQVFDLGMAVALGKPILVVKPPETTEHKSYANVLLLLVARSRAQGKLELAGV